MDITPSASGRELDFPADASPGTAPNALESLGFPARYKHGETVYRCNDPVVLPGDMFGFGAQGIQRFGVEAIAPGTLICDRPALAPAL